MQHLVVGSGLIGSYLASVLAIKKQRVSVLARGEWAKRLSGSLVVSDYLNNQAQVDKLDVLSHESELEPDFIWLTVKCTAVEDAVDTLKHYVGPNTTILCCQNGVGTHQMIVDAFPANTVLRVMVPFNVVWQAPNRLHKGSEGTLVIEQHDGVSQILMDALQHPLLAAEQSEQIENVQWAKLQLNLGNGVNALADIPVKQMLSERGYRVIIAQLMSELLAVCERADRTLPKVAAVHGRLLPTFLKLPDFLFRILGSRMLSIDPHVRTSMWWDLSMKKPTEKDALYGAVVREAERVGITAPYCEAMVALIGQAELDNSHSDKSKSLSADALHEKIKNIIKQNDARYF